MSTAIHDSVPWPTVARGLAVATVVYNLAEGAVATAFGWSEGSVALFGFGVDSFVEVGSAALVLWSLGRSGDCGRTSLERERRATRGISALLVVLAAGVALSSLARLGAHEAPDSSVPTLVVSAVSLAFMGFLWRAKRAAAVAMDSRTLAMDAACSLACIQLSVVLLAGSLASLVSPAWWWADGVAALGLAVLIGREGRNGWRAAARPDFDGGCGCGH